MPTKQAVTTRRIQDIRGFERLTPFQKHLARMLLDPRTPKDPSEVQQDLAAVTSVVQAANQADDIRLLGE